MWHYNGASGCSKINMRKLILLLFLPLLISCGESTIVADYDTISVKNLIIKDDDGKKYEVEIETETSGNKKLVLKETKE